DARIARLLHTEVQVSHAPWAGGNMTDDVVWYGGVDTVLDGWAPILHTDDAPEMILRPVALNGDVGIASWIRGRGATRMGDVLPERFACPGRTRPGDLDLRCGVVRQARPADDPAKKGWRQASRPR